MTMHSYSHWRPARPFGSESAITLNFAAIHPTCISITTPVVQ